MGPGRLPGHPRRVTQGLFCPGMSPACETKSHWYRSGLFTGRPRRVVLTGVLGFISSGGSGSGVGSVDTTVVSDTAVFVLEVVWSTRGSGSCSRDLGIVGARVDVHFFLRVRLSCPLQVLSISPQDSGWRLDVV